jgi:hypothetical protein
VQSSLKLNAPASFNVHPLVATAGNHVKSLASTPEKRAHGKSCAFRIAVLCALCYRSLVARLAALLLLLCVNEEEQKDVETVNPSF